MDRVDNPADLVSPRNYVRSIITGIVLLIAAAVTVAEILKPLPRLDALQEFEATVAFVEAVGERPAAWWDSRETRVDRYDVRFVGRSARYRYPAGTPESTEIGKLRAGDLVRVWSDVGKTYTIYQLERAGINLVTFETELDRRRRHRRYLLYFVVPFLVATAAVTFWVIGRLYYRFGSRQPKHAPR